MCLKQKTIYFYKSFFMHLKQISPVTIVFCFTNLKTLWVAMVNLFDVCIRDTAMSCRWRIALLHPRATVLQTSPVKIMNHNTQKWVETKRNHDVLFHMKSILLLFKLFFLMTAFYEQALYK